MDREALLTATFVELADTLVDDFDVVDLLTNLTSRCVEVFDVDAAGIMLAGPGDVLRVVASSSATMRVLELFEIQEAEGPCPDCYRTGDAVVATALAASADRWPRFAPEALQGGFRSALAVPLRLRGSTIGALNLFRTVEGELVAADVAAAQAFADIATISLLNRRAADDAARVNRQLTEALESRVVIEQAKGMVAERAGTSMEDAFALLRSHARSHNRRLADLATDVVDGVVAPLSLGRPAPVEGGVAVFFVSGAPVRGSASEDEGVGPVDDLLRRAPGPVVAAVVGLAYLGLAQYVIWLNDPVNAGAGYWPAAGVTLAALLVVPTRRWPWVLAAVVAAEIGGDAVHDYPLAASAWWAAGNAVEPLLAATLLRRLDGDGRLTPLRELIWFLAAGVVIGPMVGAAVGSIGTALEYGNRWGDVFLKWWAGDGLGVLVVAPLVLCLREDDGIRRSRLETLLLATAVLVVPAVAFRGWDASWDIALPYVVFPLVMWASVRYGLRGAAVVGFAVAEIANLANALGYGPFGIRGDEGQAKTVLQVFLGTVLTGGLVIATLVRDAVRRARIFEAQRTVAEVLQAAVLPDDLPVVAGLSFAARYSPAVEDDVSHVGGDWYDAFTLADGSLTVVVGDVSGHDVAAALVMGQVRNGVRTLFVEHDDPERILSILDRQLGGLPDGPIATAVCLRYLDGELVWTNAGHPPLLVLRSDGAASYLDDSPGPVLGFGEGVHTRQTTRLEPGDVLIAFTDGVIEHRDWSLDEGLDHLRYLARTAGTRDPDALCDHLLAGGLAGRPRTDDACILVMARTS